MTHMVFESVPQLIEDHSSDHDNYIDFDNQVKKCLS